jgi:hypothetical protein
MSTLGHSEIILWICVSRRKEKKRCKTPKINLWCMDAIDRCSPMPLHKKNNCSPQNSGYTNTFVNLRQKVKKRNVNHYYMYACLHARTDKDSMVYMYRCVCMFIPVVCLMPAFLDLDLTTNSGRWGAFTNTYLHVANTRPFSTKF